MKLPDVLETRRRVNDSHRFRLSHLSRAIIYNRDPGPDRVNQSLRVCSGSPMTRSNEKIDHADAVVRAHQVKLFVPHYSRCASPNPNRRGYYLEMNKPTCAGINFLRNLLTSL